MEQCNNIEDDSFTENNKDCPFCTALKEGGTKITDKNGTRNSPTLKENDSFYAVYDLFPVTPHHTLIISKRHVSDYRSLSYKEWGDLKDIIDLCINHISNAFNCRDFNIGMNVGKNAGQTVMHFHLHLFDRYEGDVPNPKGGIRNFKTPIVSY